MMNHSHRDKKTKIAKTVAWSVFALSMLLFAANTYFRFSISDPSIRSIPALVDVGFALQPLGFGALGALIVNYRSDNRIGWLSIIIGLSLLLVFTGEGYVLFTISNSLMAESGISMAAWIGNLAFVPLALMTVLFPLVFPDGKFLSENFRRLAFAAIIILGLLVVTTAFWPGPMDNITVSGPITFTSQIDNPIAFDVSIPPALEKALPIATNFAGGFFVLIASSSLFFRWQRASTEEQKQLKWVTSYVVIVVSLFVLTENFGALYYPQLFSSTLYLPFAMSAWLGFPIVIGIAIFKYRLYDIDLIIRRTLIYASLTLILAAVYFSSVFLLQLFTPVQSQLSIVASTLVIAALFSPLRQWIQRAIDRRFYRQKYDADKILKKFNARIRDEVDLEQINAELEWAIGSSVQPEHVSIWINNNE